MKKPITVLLVFAMLAVTVGFNLQSRTSQTLNQSRSETNAKLLDAQDLAELEGGRWRLRCIGVLAAAVALAASGPGLLASGAMAIIVVCGCDRELDRLFGTHFRRSC